MEIKNDIEKTSALEDVLKDDMTKEFLLWLADQSEIENEVHYWWPDKRNMDNDTIDQMSSCLLGYLL